MLRYGLIEPYEKDYGFMSVKEAPKNTYVPAVINENKRIMPGEPFLPDALLVNVISTASKKVSHMFQFVHFPANGDLSKFRQHLMHHKDKEYHIKFSDFNLLCFLTNILDIELVCTIAKNVINQQRFDEKTRKQITKVLKNAGC